MNHEFILPETVLKFISISRERIWSMIFNDFIH